MHIFKFEVVSYSDEDSRYTSRKYADHNAPCLEVKECRLDLIRLELSRFDSSRMSAVLRRKHDIILRLTPLDFLQRGLLRAGAPRD